MKKKKLVMSTMILGALTLSACSLESIFDIRFSFDSDSTSQTSSGDESSSGSESTSQGGLSSSESGGSTSESSGGGSTSTSTPSGTLSKTNIKETYNDYVKYNAYCISNCPTTGNPKVLIIPVWFKDSNNYISTTKKADVKSDIETAYLGSADTTGWHSVRSFYFQESHGDLNLTGKVTDWYSPNIYSSSVNSTSATNTLVQSATDWYFENNSSDSRKNYDTNGDGWLDAVVLIYAAPDHQAYSGSNDNLWAYCYWLQNSSNQNTATPGPNVYFFASYDFMYDTAKATSRAGTSYSHGDCSHCNIDAHTFIHEFGHVMGLDDYYDYSDYSYLPAGGFSMQDYNVGGHDPYSVMALGWADPYIPTTSTTITLHAFQSSHELILLTPSWNSYDSPFDEYLLLELYTPTLLNKFDTDYRYENKYPQGPDEVGIRLWHVDARLGYYIYNSYTDTWSTCSSSQMVKTTKGGYVEHAMCNTYDDETSETRQRLSMFFEADTANSKYANYNLLQLIRNDTSMGYKPDEVLSSGDLFTMNRSFSMSTFKKQFVNSTKLNSGVDLGWSFTVTNISGSGDSAQATIELVKQ